MIKHSSAKIESMFGPNLKDEGSKGLCHMGFMSTGKPIIDFDLVKNGELGGQYRGTDVALGKPGKKLASSDD